MLYVCVMPHWPRGSVIMVMIGAKIFIEIGGLSISIKNGKGGSFKVKLFMEPFGIVRLKGIGSSVRRQYLIYISRSGNNKYWTRHGVYLRRYYLRQ